jgi:hypothetical protein
MTAQAPRTMSAGRHSGNGEFHFRLVRDLLRAATAPVTSKSRRGPALGSAD